MAMLPGPVTLTLRKKQGQALVLQAPDQVSYSFHIPESVKEGEYNVQVNSGQNQLFEENIFIPLPRWFMREHAPSDVIFTDPERPWRLAVGQDRQIYFTRNAASFSVLSLQGEEQQRQMYFTRNATSFSVLNLQGEKQQRHFQCNNMVFARGIAVATEGENTVVYITGDHMLQKYRDDGNFLGQLGGEEGPDFNQFSDPNGIRIYKNRVYVCDSGNGRIQVLSMDLEGHDTILVGRGVLLHPEDLDFDDLGNMYVADSTHRSVEVFTPCSNNGEYQYERIAVMGLPFPVSLRIFRGTDRQAYLCISARDGCCFIVYTLQGELIRRVQISNDENKTLSRGALRLLTSGTRRSINYVAPNLRPTQPLGLAVDGDGFLYVACCNCNQIQVFE